MTHNNETNNTLTAVLLITAALTFWISWYLMPDQGTADTRHILTIVKDNRISVFYSVIIQIISSVLYIPALFLLSKLFSPFAKMELIGTMFLAIGAMGMCADAFFHLLAFYMTEDSVHIQSDIINLMTFMQTKGIVFLVPLLLPFFIGSFLLATGLRKQNHTTRWPQLIFILAFVTAILGGIIVNKFIDYGRSTLVLFVLGLFALGQIIIGVEIAKRELQPQQSLQPESLT